MEPSITAEKVLEPISKMFIGDHRILITESRKDEAGNDYEYTRVKYSSVDTIQAQKNNLQKQMDALDEELAAINLL